VNRRFVRWAAVSTVVIVALGVLAARRGRSHSTSRVERGEFKVEISIGGNLKAVDSSPVGPPTIEGMYQFKVSMLAPEGTEVQEGTPVLAFDTTELSQKLLTRRAEVQSSAKQIEKKEIDILKMRQDQDLQMAEAEARLRRARLKSSAPSELVTGIETRRAELDLELAEIEVATLKRRIAAARRAAEAELKGLQGGLRKAEIDVGRIEAAIGRMNRTAPRDGVVTYIADWRGEKVKVGDTVWVSEKVLEIPDLERMEAEGEVEEALAGRLEAGQKVSVVLDAHPDRRFDGVIQSISRTVRTKSWRNPLKVVGIKITLDETDPERMRPGMHFKGSVVVERLPDVLMAPLDAVRMTERGATVLRKTMWGIESVDVTTGPRDGQRVVILNGLAEGDRFVTGREAP